MARGHDRTLAGIFGAAAVRQPIVALLCWLAVIVPLSIAGIGIDGRLQSLAMTMEQSPSGKVIVRETQAFGPRNLAVIVLAGPREQLSGTRDRLAQRLRQEDVALTGPVMTGRGGAWMLVAQMRGTDSTLTRTTMPAVRRTVAATVEPPAKAYITGYVDAGSVLIERSVEDIRRFELIAAPLLLIVLLAVFRTPLAALMPLLIGLTTIGACGGALALLDRVMAIDVFAFSIASMMGLALGVDYALVIVSRFREERSTGAGMTTAATTTAAAAGETVLTAGTILLMGGAAIALIVPGAVIESAAIGLMLAAVFSVIGATVALPAMLRLTGPWLDRLPLFGRQHRPGRGRFATLIARPLRRPVLWNLAALALLLPLSYLGLGMPTGPSGFAEIPQDTIQAKDAKASAALFGWRFHPYQVLLEVGDGRHITDPDVLAGLAAWQRRMASDPRVAAVFGPGQVADRVARIAPQGLPARTSGALVLAAIRAGPRSLRDGAGTSLNIERGGNAALITVFGVRSAVRAGDPLRTTIERHARELARATGGRTGVAGPAAVVQDFETQLQRALPRLLVALALLTLAALVLILRSWPHALVAVALNALTTAATCGGLALLFGGENPLLGGGGYVDLLPAIAIIGVVFALSIDYTLFLLMRMHEHHRDSGDAALAISEGLRTTAGVITGAAAMMLGVFLAFATSSLIHLVQTGLGLAIAVLIDASVIRLILLPTALRLLGDRGWGRTPGQLPASTTSS